MLEAAAADDFSNNSDIRALQAYHKLRKPVEHSFHNLGLLQTWMIYQVDCIKSSLNFSSILSWLLLSIVSKETFGLWYTILLGYSAIIEDRLSNE